jgi:hypothetical protein
VIYELIVTSAKRALQAGRSGFAAVMRTRGMHPELQSRLEALSGYRHLYPQGDPRNPVILTHIVIDSVAGKFSVFSRTVDAGSDYSGRSNKLSHHVACDASEIRNAARSSPAAALKWLEENGRFASRWEDEPREQDPAAPARFPPSDPAKCTAWEAAAGDAGWAGVLVDRTLKGMPTWIIVPAGVDTVALLTEAMALMEPSRRWGVSFTTHAMADAGFVWKVAAEGSAEEKAARERGAATVIDVTRPARTDDDGPYVQAARGLAETPWKKSATAKPVDSGTPSPSGRSSSEFTHVTAPAVQREAAAPLPTTRPAPPPLVKPPPVVRPPDILGGATGFPHTARDSVISRGNSPLMAAAVAVGLLVAFLLGLLVDVQLRGEGSVIRKVAALIPRDQGDEKLVNGSHAGDRSPTNPLAVDAESNKGGTAQSDETGRSGEPPRNEETKAIAGGDRETPRQEAEKDSSQKPIAHNSVAASSLGPQEPNKPSTPAKTDSSVSRTNDATKAAEATFEPVREAVESQQHLPKDSLLDAAKDAAAARKSGPTLVALKQGTPLPLVGKLVLLPADSPFTVDAEPKSSHETRWTCRTADKSAAAETVGTFVLNASGLFFEAAVTQRSDVERLGRCCLLIIGKDNTEATYLQLSRPTEVAPLPFTLEPRQEAPCGVMESQVQLPLQSVESLDAGKDSGEVSLQITTATSPNAQTFEIPIPSFVSPLAGKQLASFMLEKEKLQVPLACQLTTGKESLSLAITINPFADKPQFDRICKAISGGGNINFENTFWPFVKSELLKAMPKTEDQGTDRKTSTARLSRVLDPLKENLKPPKKAAVPFATYVDSLREVLFHSPSLKAKAEAAVDKRHPPAPPAKEKPEAAEKDAKKEDKDEKPAFDREAEVSKETESLFPAWCAERLAHLESQNQKSATPDGPNWTDADLDEYAALFLWSRIQHLEQCVKAFGLPDAPAAMTGTARFELRRTWAVQSLPEGVSCRPEKLLLRTTP